MLIQRASATRFSVVFHVCYVFKLLDSTDDVIFFECLNRNYHNFLGIVEYVTDKMENIYTDQSRTT